jgi:predicted unusual protein kinase regulating ubiquinone biosynthesis (AarF/ABC1/UbiB family)
MSEKLLTEGGWKRSLKVGVTCAKVGGKVLQKKSHNLLFKDKEYALEKEEEMGEIIFLALGQLKGLALKAAQILGQEAQMIPEPIRKKLQQSFNQVPALNRSLVRKMMKNSLGQGINEVFAKFDEKASGAASLGQVHKGVLHSGEEVAVKIQYPGVATAMAGDLKLIKRLVKGFADSDFFEQSYQEVEIRLLEEVDYLNEAKNIKWFNENTSVLRVPKVYPEISSNKVLTMEWIEGECLHQWLLKNPSQDEKNRVSQALWDFFIDSVYSLKCLHADPNPGNIIIQPDGTIALIDFGCVKHFSDDFARRTREAFPKALNSYDLNPVKIFIEYDLMQGSIPEDKEQEYNELICTFHKHIRKPYDVEYFDFGENSGYVDDWFTMGKNMSVMYKHITSDPDFIFMDRVRYGFLRFFTQMKAKVKIRNKYELGEHY